MSLKIYKEIEKGKEFAKAGDYVSAKNIFNNILKNDPYNNQARFNLSKLETVNTKIDLNLIKEKINHHFNNNDFKEVILIGEKYFSKLQNDLDFLNKLGLSYKNLNNYDDSKKVFQIGLNSNKFQDTFHNNLGMLNFKFKKFESAVLCFEKAIKINPNKIFSYNNLGNSYLEINDYKNTHLAYTKAFNLNKNDFQTLYNLANFYNKINNEHKAIELYENALKVNPNHAWLLNDYGTCLNKLNLYEEALIFINKAISIDSKIHEFYFNLGNTYSHLNNYKLSVKNYNEALQLKKDDLQSLINLSNAHYNFGEFDKSYETLLNLLQKNDISILANLLGIPNYKNYIDVQHYFHQMKRKSNNRKLIVLRGFGRSGTLFLHSLIDNHPQISTLPGYFFKGFFGYGVWNKILPKTKDKFHKNLATNIYLLFEQQFNSSKKGNVPGLPNKYSNWLSQSTGFTTLGKNRNGFIKLDKVKFIEKLTEKITPLKNISQAQCFECIHDVFDEMTRKNELPSHSKLIFYHMHNPNNYELLNFLTNYPDSKILYLIRNPIQSMESLLRLNFNKILKLKDDKKIINEWLEIIKTITEMINLLFNPLNLITPNYALTLENLKNNKDSELRSLCDFLNIEYNDELKKSEFVGLDYSRPSTDNTFISGFQKTGINRKIGEFFSKSDVHFFNHFFKQVNTEFYNHDKYGSLLNEIKLKEKKALDFETKIFCSLNNKNLTIDNCDPYIYLRNYLKQIKNIITLQKTENIPITFKNIKKSI